MTYLWYTLLDVVSSPVAWIFFGLGIVFTLGVLLLCVLFGPTPSWPPPPRPRPAPLITADLHAEVPLADALAPRPGYAADLEYTWRSHPLTGSVLRARPITAHSPLTINVTQAGGRYGYHAYLTPDETLSLSEWLAQQVKGVTS